MRLTERLARLEAAHRPHVREKPTVSDEERRRIIIGAARILRDLGILDVPPPSDDPAAVAAWRELREMPGAPS